MAEKKPNFNDQAMDKEEDEEQVVAEAQNQAEEEQQQTQARWFCPKIVIF